MRIIPKNTRVKMELFKGVGLVDVLIGLVGITIVVFLFLSNITFKYWLMLAVTLLFVILVVKIDDDQTYVLVNNIIRHLSYRRNFAKNPDAKAKKKEYDIKDITPFSKIENGLIDFNGKYVAGVIEISPIEFKFYSEFRQNNLIDRVFGAILRNLSGEQAANLVKIDRPVNYDDYIQSENQKIAELRNAFTNGMLTEEEFNVRLEILTKRRENIDYINKEIQVIKSYHYLVIYDTDKTLIEEQLKFAYESLTANNMNVKVLNDKELAIFLKYNYTYNFDEREVDNIEPENYMAWILPDKIEMFGRTIEYDGIVTHNLRITDFPMSVYNAWGYRLFDIPDTKVVMKLKPVDKYQAVRRIDRAIDELRGQGNATGKTSKLIELSNHIDTLSEVLATLQSDNETLFEVNIYITIYDRRTPEEKAKSRVNLKKRVKRLLSEDGFKTDDLFMQQFDAYVGTQLSAYDPLIKKSRSIHSTSVAAVFPFVNSVLSDEGGINLGNSNGYPVFLNFFKRDRERVNSNMVVIGKSGSGKSYATKMMLTNLAAEDSKVFILDPENEYSTLAKNLHGKLIDVGSAKQGRLNPFQIVASVDETEDEGAANTSFAAHLQFLEEFFRQILSGLDNDAMEYLNNLILRVYATKGIDETTDISKLKPADFPTFDDLYDAILFEYQKTQGDYSKNNLRTLLTYISKFSTGGRNSNLWNGEATISTEENFVVFNFQSLLANKNNTIANAQMLLVLKWLDNEIIKNRDYNMKYNANRKIIVVIDEAHVFIDEKYPIALDFMFQLAKRIRKYNGMQIIITQNIKDFVGTEEIARKSTAIINACQYSFIFALAPNDMHDLCKLYEKAGEINESEQEKIINNGRGQAFVVTSPTSRTSIEIVAAPEVEELFS